MFQVRAKLMSRQGAGQLTNNDVRKLGAWYTGGPNYWSTPKVLDCGN
jgi:hypothetical protein